MQLTFMICRTLVAFVLVASTHPTANATGDPGSAVGQLGKRSATLTPVWHPAPYDRPFATSPSRQSAPAGQEGGAQDAPAPAPDTAGPAAAGAPGDSEAEREAAALARAKQAEDRAALAQRRAAEAQRRAAEAQQREANALTRANDAEVKRAADEVKALKRALDAARARGDVDADRLARMGRELAQATGRLQDANAAAANARAETTETRKAKEQIAEQKGEADKRVTFLERYSRYIAVGAVLLVALGVLLATLLSLRARRRTAALKGDLDRQADKEKARDNAADWVLVGTGGRLKLRGLLLADIRRGAIVGRGQSDADVIVDEPRETVSRRHARFFYRDSALMLEDLRSLNGTFVNGRRMDAGEICEVRESDAIKFAEIAFTLRRA